MEACAVYKSHSIQNKFAVTVNNMLRLLTTLFYSIIAVVRCVFTMKFGCLELQLTKTNNQIECFVVFVAVAK